MPLNPKALEQLEIEAASARGQVAGNQMAASVSDEAKMIANAILWAGAQIALAIAARDA